MADFNNSETGKHSNLLGPPAPTPCRGEEGAAGSSPDPKSENKGYPYPKRGPDRKKRRTHKKPNPRAYAIAQNLLRGDSKKEACIKAGYSANYALTSAKRLVAREDVSIALVELGSLISTEKLGTIAKARLHEDLISPPKGDKGAKARLGIVRTGLEVAGLLGGPSELHLHNHTHLSPTTQRMMGEMMLKLAKEKGMVIDGGATISERAEGESEGEEDIRRVESGDAALGVKEGSGSD